MLLINNHADGMVRGIQSFQYNRQFTASERDFDASFANIARECGFGWCRKVRSRAELENSLDGFLKASGPCFLEVVTDREEEVYPLIPQGKGYKDMLLGPYIKDRGAQ